MTKVLCFACSELTGTWSRENPTSYFKNEFRSYFVFIKNAGKSAELATFLFPRKCHSTYIYNETCLIKTGKHWYDVCGRSSSKKSSISAHRDKMSKGVSPTQKAGYQSNPVNPMYLCYESCQGENLLASVYIYLRFQDDVVSGICLLDNSKIFAVLSKYFFWLSAFSQVYNYIYRSLN